DGSALNVTIQKYYTPKGTSIHGVGVVPDHEVAVSEKYAGTAASAIPPEEDVQLEVAMNILAQKMN
ncbi:MAG: S41 family peptidase, partial [Bacillota bacterium]|nr:S41 family peptidase [Bacillota bacterium]